MLVLGDLFAVSVRLPWRVFELISSCLPCWFLGFLVFPCGRYPLQVFGFLGQVARRRSVSLDALGGAHDPLWAACILEALVFCGDLATL